MVWSLFSLHDEVFVCDASVSIFWFVACRGEPSLIHIFRLDRWVITVRDGSLVGVTMISP